MVIPKLTQNGIYKAEKLTIVRKGQPLVEVAVPPIIHEIPVPPSEEVCRKLYPCPIEPPPEPEPPEPPTDIDWDKTAPDPGNLRDETKYPLITTITKLCGKTLESILFSESGLRYPNISISYNTGPGAGGVYYPVLRLLPLTMLEKWFEWYMTVPKGYKDSGPHSAYEQAIMAHYCIRRWGDFAIADFYTKERFNICFAWDKDLSDCHAYAYDTISLGYSPLLISKDQFKTINALHPG